MREARTPNGKGRASSKAVLKLLPVPSRTDPVFGRAGRGLGLFMIRQGTLEGSGIRTMEGDDASDTGALIFAARFRLRYSRIQAALRAGSR